MITHLFTGLVPRIMRTITSQRGWRVREGGWVGRCSAAGRGVLVELERESPTHTNSERRPTPPSLQLQDKASQIVEKSCKDVQVL